MRSPFSLQNTSLYILAGGKSSRFGEDKAHFIWKNKSLIDHVRHTFVEIGDMTAILKSSDERFEMRCIYDECGRGPLSGIHAALSDSDTDWVFIAPCDTLGFSIAWLESFSGESKMAIAFFDDRWFPLFSAFHKDALPIIEKNLNDGKFAVWKTLDDLEAKKIPTPLGWENLLRIDTKEDIRNK